MFAPKRVQHSTNCFRKLRTSPDGDFICVVFCMVGNVPPHARNDDKHFNQKVLGFVLRVNANLFSAIKQPTTSGELHLASKFSVYDSLLTYVTTTNFRVIAFRKCFRQIPRSCYFAAAIRSSI